MKHFIILLLLTISVSAFSPPLWPSRFTEDFIQGDKSSKIFTSGKLWYDVKNNRQRCDVKNDYFDLLCSTVSLKSNSTCSQVFKNNNLYIWLPEENQCCKCCTSEQGCKITSQDWLKDYEYVGRRSISWDIFDVWSHYDLPVNTTYYATIGDVPIPRRQDYGSYGIDFLTGTYSEDQIDDKVFALPSYCEKDCPKTSFCQNFKIGNVKYEKKGLFGEFRQQVVKRNINSQE